MEKQVSVEKQVISIEDLCKVKGIGPKAIERIKEQLEVNEEEANYISEYDEELHLDLNEIHLGDCLELMNGIPDKSVDMILADLPYGTTALSWDRTLSTTTLWKHYKRVLKDDGVVVLTASQPFTTELIQSNKAWFRYDWVWYKNLRTGFLNAKIMPMRSHEDILVFYKEQPTYNPQKTERETQRAGNTLNSRTSVYGVQGEKYLNNQSDKVHPHTVLDNIKAIHGTKGRINPTQKPVELFEYLIKTYTNEGDTVLDNVIGSGTTAIACINTGRNYIGIEMDEEYHSLAVQRVKDYIPKEVSE